jgi:hypothetical protein
MHVNFKLYFELCYLNKAAIFKMADQRTISIII